MTKTNTHLKTKNTKNSKYKLYLKTNVYIADFNLIWSDHLPIIFRFSTNNFENLFFFFFDIFIFDEEVVFSANEIIKNLRNALTGLPEN